jgi:FdhD protein
MNMEKTENRTIVRIDSDGRRAQDDLVIREHALTITLNDRQFVTMLCSPCDLEALGLGFLLSEGVIKSLEDVESLSLSDDEDELSVYLKDDGALGEELFGKRAITSGCGRGSMFYSIMDALDFQEVSWDVEVSAGSILGFASELQSRSELFKTTGGAHAAALCKEGGMLVFKDDIGRHNAVDKVFGECLMKGIETGGKILITTGRISSEILLKSVRRGIAVVASRSAPTGLAVEFAEKAGITLVGFVRGKRMNVYSNEHRLLDSSSR